MSWLYFCVIYVAEEVWGIFMSAYFGVILFIWYEPSRCAIYQWYTLTPS